MTIVTIIIYKQTQMPKQPHNESEDDIKDSNKKQKTSHKQANPVWSFAITIRIHPIINEFYHKILEQHDIKSDPKESFDFNKIDENVIQLIPTLKDMLLQKANMVCDQLWNDIKDGDGDRKEEWKFIFQIEVGKETGKFHLQMYLRTADKKRRPEPLAKELVSKLNLPSVHAAAAVGEAAADALQHYVMKQDTRVGDKQWNDKQKEPGIGCIYKPRYKGEELKKIFDSPRPWQLWINNLLKEEPDDRTVHWIVEEHGNVGKSALVKAWCFHDDSCQKIPIGTASQLKSFCCTIKQKRTYFLDIPRSLGRDSNMRDVFEAIEELKNGFINSCMYGLPKSLFMDPPHVLCFANFIPDQNLVSIDRWKLHKIDQETMEIEEIDFPEPEEMGLAPGQNANDIRNYGTRVVHHINT